MPSGLPTCSLEANFGTRRERLDFQFNPATLRYRIAVEYGTVLPFQGSHETAHYSGTRSLRTPLELFFTLFDKPPTQAFPKLDTGPDETQVVAPLGPLGILASLSEAAAGAGSDASVTLAGVERFLNSLCYNDPDKNMPAPPLVYFDWPGVLLISGRVEELEIEYPQFASESLVPLTLVARMLFREDRDRDHRISSSGVRREGAIRSGVGLESSRIARPQAPQRQTITLSVPITGGASRIGGS